MKAKVVASTSNQAFKDLRKLLSTRGIQEQGLALFAGDKLIKEVFAAHFSLIEAWITLPEGLAPPREVPWLQLTKELFDELDQFGTGGPLITVRVPEFREWRADDEWPKGCSLFLAMQNPDNVGAVVRSAAAFGVSRVVLLKEAAHPFHPKAMRAGGTALLATDFWRGPSIKELNVGPVPRRALDAGGVPLRQVQFPASFALLPGVEGPGIPSHIAPAARVSIPMNPGVESLNAGVATAIALYEWRSR
jgi:16S rRNA (guanine527-N7)-methyltransferase